MTGGEHLPAQGEDPHDDGEEALRQVQASPPARARTVALLLIVAVAALGALLAVGLVPRLQERGHAEATGPVRPAEPPVVRTVHPRRASVVREISLPSDIRPMRETALYARTNGYVRRWLNDIGDPIRKGQLLAEIEAPELAQELAQAEASVPQAEANLAQSKARAALARVTLKRTQTLFEKGLAPPQDLDTQRAALETEVAGIAALEATIRGNQANVRRLRELLSFTRIVAPFSGRVTARNLEIGALVTGGNTSATPLFQVQQWNPARLFTRVPQVFAASMRPGQKMQARVRGLGGRTFEGKVVRTSGALDPQTRTLLVESHIPNPEGTLMGGMYAEVSLAVRRENPPWILPLSTVVTDARGSHVAVVRQGKLILLPVSIEEEQGTEIGVRGALSAGDEVVQGLDPTLAEGAVVHPRPLSTK
jgi:RND family efflux transporter MFP subunit